MRCSRCKCQINYEKAKYIKSLGLNTLCTVCSAEVGGGVCDKIYGVRA